MNSRFLVLLCSMALSEVAVAQTASDTNEGAKLIHNSGNSFTLYWWGRSGRTYFLQHSEDLKTWLYFPDVIAAVPNNIPAILSYGFNVTGPDRFFLRLEFSDIATSNPATADFDGDGLSNAAELLLGTDPLSANTDGDGLSDGNEFLIGYNPKVADSTVDSSDRLLDVHTPLAP